MLTRRRLHTSPEEREQALAFRITVVARGARCIVCGYTEEQARATGTRLTAHHVITQQHLRKYGYESLRWSVENGTPVCDEPCHRRHSSARERIPRAKLPVAAVRFAEELGMEWYLTRYYG